MWDQQPTNPREPMAARLARELQTVRRQLDVVIGMVATVLLFLITIGVILLVR